MKLILSWQKMALAVAGVVGAVAPWAQAENEPAKDTRPNILFIITDDHAVQALGSCDKDSPVPLPGFRRLAKEGMVFDRAYCANSLCGPSRACMLTGRHTHRNGFTHNEGGTTFDSAQPTYPKMLQAAGYQTGIVGKWHLVSNPVGFTSWQIFPGQGYYFDPAILTEGPNGRQIAHRDRGYVTDIITTKAIDWMENRDKSKPFALVVGHKAPHRNWLPAPRHLQVIREYVAKLTPPANLHEDWADRPEFLKLNRQTVGWDLCNWNDSKLQPDLIPFEVMKEIVPKQTLRKMIKDGRFSPVGFDIEKHEPKFATKTNYWDGLGPVEKGVKPLYREFYEQRTREFVKDFKAGKIKTQKDITERRWRWYMEDYLGVILAVDESVATLLNYLDSHELSENTLVIYVGDQGFYMGEHGMYDKRWILEESLRMPLVMRWKGHIPAGKRSQAIVQNIDYAPTIVDVAGAGTPENMKKFDGVSLKPLFATGEAEGFADRAIYYAFYEQPGEHNAARHDGMRNNRYTLARIWTPTPEERKAGVRKPGNEWMLFDNKKDPMQMHNVATKPEYKGVFEKLKATYDNLRAKYGVPENSPGSTNPIPKFKPSWD